MEVLALDLGASNGRAYRARLRDGNLSFAEMDRFEHAPVSMSGHLYWDFPGLFARVKQAIQKAAADARFESLGIDAWGLDFGCLDRNGELLANPHYHRDAQADGAMKKLLNRMSREEIFDRTGVQFIPANSLYHLYAMKLRRASAVEHAEKLLMIPDLIRYFLTGQAFTEWTIATTTQMVNIASGVWDEQIAGIVGIPPSILCPLVHPGTRLGPLLPQLQEELALGPAPVVAVGEHDTASAVVAVPAAEQEFAYISCGTWALVGTEIARPVVTGEALKDNFTNEGGVGGTYRLLKNVTGLWLLQRAMRQWGGADRTVTYPAILAEAAAAGPSRAFVDPDDPRFVNPLSMVDAVQSFCRERGEPAPEGRGQIARCILESLALKFSHVIRQTERLTGRQFPVIHLVGGGSRNPLLCQYTANASGRPVLAGPAEASAIGNAMVQYMALGEVGSLRDMRAIVKRSFPVTVYEAKDDGRWRWATDRLGRLS